MPVNAPVRMTMISDRKPMKWMRSIEPADLERRDHDVADRLREEETEATQRRDEIEGHATKRRDRAKRRRPQFGRGRRKHRPILAQSPANRPPSLKKIGEKNRPLPYRERVAHALDSVWSVVNLLGGTFVLRPYVVGFLAFFLAAAVRDLGRARTLGFLVWGFLVALVAELSSTREGLPLRALSLHRRHRGRGAVPRETSRSSLRCRFRSWPMRPSASPARRSGRARPRAVRVVSARRPWPACSWPCWTS